MKLLRSFVVGLFAAGLVAVFASVSFAAVQQAQPVAAKNMHKGKVWTEAEKKEHELAQIKLFNDAATALQKTNPDLSAGLTKYANEEAQEKEGKAEKEELEGKAEKDMGERAVANLKLLRDAASALQTSNPTLAAALTKTADQHAKRIEMKKEGKEDTEKMEAKEAAGMKDAK